MSARRKSRRSRTSRRSRSSRRARASRRTGRRRGNYAPQPITRPGSRAGLVDVVEVDGRGSVLRVLQRNVSYERARDFIVRATRAQ